MRLALLHSTLRGDEKLIIEAAKQAGIDLDIVDARTLVLSQNFTYNWDVILERCVSTTLGMAVLEYFAQTDTPTVNTIDVARICENKFTTSQVLAKAGVNTPRFALAFNEAQALEAVQSVGGYPLVIKPVSGSWGRLISKVNDRDALEAIIDHKHVLGSPAHKPIYLQEYINKPGRDIRVTMVNHNVVCAIYRNSEHWITNTARGAEAVTCQVDRDLQAICEQTSQAVGGGVLGIDVFETDEGYSVNEVNHTVEFKNVQRVTGVNVAQAIVEYCQEVSHV